MPNITGHTELVGLMAYPIRHTQSPTTHNLAYDKNGDDVIQLAFEVDNDTLEAAVESIRALMLMYGKEASNRKQEIDRQHYTIPNQRPKDKHCGKI